MLEKMIVVDIETTGTDPQKHAMIDLAALDFENPSYQFHRSIRIFEGVEIEQEALDYNGFTLEEISDPKRPELAQVLEEFKKWLEPIKEKTMAGQNPDFDMEFLRANAERAGIKLPLTHRKLDQHTLAYFKMRELEMPVPMDEKGRSNLNSDKVMEWVGIPPEPKPHHSALNGVLWEAEAFSRLMEGKNLLPQFANYPVPEYLKK